MLKLGYAGLAVVFLLASCTNGLFLKDPSGTSLATVRIHVPSAAAAKALKGNNAHRSAPRAALGTYEDIASISVDVYASDGGKKVLRDPLATVDLVQDDTGWSGVIPRLPVDQELRFVGLARDWDYTTIFEGSTYVTLSEGSNNVILNLDAIDDGVAYTFPALKRLLFQQHPAVGADFAVALQVRGPADTEVSYELSAASGSVTPDHGGVWIDDQGAGTADLVYTAPTVAGTETITVTLKTAQGQQVTQDVTFNVDPVAEGQLTVSFGPAIRGFSLYRSGSDLYLTANVTDDGPLGPASWTFNGEPVEGDGLTVVVGGYSQSVGADVTFEVSDNDGNTTSAEFTIEPGQFPDDPVVLDQSVALWTDNTYFDYGVGYYGSEASNLESLLTGTFGLAVDSYGDLSDVEAVISGLENHHILVVPEQEVNEIDEYLDEHPEVFEALDDFLGRGGLLVTAWDTNLVSRLSDIPISTQDAGSSEYWATEGTSALPGTAPESVFNNDATSVLLNLPEGAVPLYGNSEDGYPAALIPSGAGSILYLGWDFFDAAPVGSSDNGWLQLLGAALGVDYTSTFGPAGGAD